MPSIVPALAQISIAAPQGAAKPASVAATKVAKTAALGDFETALLALLAGNEVADPRQVVVAGGGKNLPDAGGTADADETAAKDGDKPPDIAFAWFGSGVVLPPSPSPPPSLPSGAHIAAQPTAPALPNPAGAIAVPQADRPTADPAATLVAQPPIAPAANPATRLVAQPAIAPAANPATRLVAQPAIAPAANPATRLVAQPAIAPVANPVTTLVAQPSIALAPNPAATVTIAGFEAGIPAALTPASAAETSAQPIVAERLGEERAALAGMSPAQTQTQPAAIPIASLASLGVAATPVVRMTGATLAAAVPLETAAPGRRALRDPTAETAFTLAAPDAVVAPAIAAPGQSQQGMLDTRHQQWVSSMIDKIEALREAMPGKDGTRISLLPDALGKVDVSIRTEGDRIHVHFATETQAARQLLTDAQPHLNELAEARGLKLGQTSVDAGNTGTGTGAGQQRQAEAQARTPLSPGSASLTPDDAEADTDQRIA